MSPITTHVLDLTTGRPAAGMAVALSARGGDGKWSELARGIDRRRRPHPRPARRRSPARRRGLLAPVRHGGLLHRPGPAHVLPRGRRLVPGRRRRRALSRPAPAQPVRLLDVPGELTAQARRAAHGFSSAALARSRLSRRSFSSRLSGLVAPAAATAGFAAGAAVFLGGSGASTRSRPVPRLCDDRLAVAGDHHLAEQVLRLADRRGRVGLQVEDDLGAVLRDRRPARPSPCWAGRRASPSPRRGSRPPC